MQNLPYYLRRRHVLEVLEGVDGRQLRKMVESGTLNPVRLHSNARALFLREEVLRVKSGRVVRNKRKG